VVSYPFVAKGDCFLPALENSEAHQGKMVVEQGQPDGGEKQGGLLSGHCQGRHDS